MLPVLGLVIESVTATSISSSAPLGRHVDGAPSRRYSKRVRCSGECMGEMLPAAGPEIRDDRPQKPKSVEAHKDGPALDGTNPFSTSPAPRAPARATPGIPTPARRRRSRRQFPPHPPAAAGMRPLRPPIAGSAPAMGSPAVMGGASCAAHAGNPCQSGRARARRDQGRA